jgi:RNA polymerase sigma-70 factor, ECF subfamily
MESAIRTNLEEAVGRDLAVGDLASAASRALEGYGPEVFGLLASLHRSEDDAAEVFSVWSERLWRSLSSWQRDCTMRTWAYKLARNASSNFLRDAQRRRKREVPVGSEAFSELAKKVRAASASHLRLERERELQGLRESLSHEDQIILVLRVDQEMDWAALARVLLEADAPGEEDLRREAARARKRFQLIKDRLTTMARERGVLAPSAK